MNENDKVEELDRKVLVVDDIRTNRIVLVKTLQKLGVEAIEVEDGEQALDLCKKQLFPLIFMDIDMPVMDGLEATRQIRALENGSEESPIVAITAGGVRATEDICLEVGMNAHYMKPINKNIVIQILEDWYPFDFEGL